MSANAATGRERTTGVLLAGGRATRMGGMDKGLLDLAGRPMVAHVSDRLRPQVVRLLINANRNHAEHGRFGDGVVADSLPGFLGPLAGLLAGMENAATALTIMVPCDSPFVAPDLVGRMVAGIEAEDGVLAVAHDGARRQPVFLLARTALAGDLRAWLQGGGRKIDAWFENQRIVDVDFSDQPDMFLNINTPDERDAIAARLVDAPA